MKNEGFAIVTGSARGIGAALAEQLASEGHNVVINYVSEKSAPRAEAHAASLEEKYGVKTIVVRADVSKFEDCKMLVEAGVEAFGEHIAVLVNNAGIDWLGSFVDEPLEIVEDVIQTNLMSQVYMCKLVLPYMIKQHYGDIVGISSNAALMGNSLIDYSAAKAGICGLTRSLSYTYAKDNIKVNAIAPGMFETELLSSGPEHEKYLSLIPLQRTGQVDELKILLHYLIASDFMTGQVVSPNGGTAF